MSISGQNISNNKDTLDIVLDTNCLIQMISRRSPYYDLWQHFINGSYRLCVTNEIIDEYEEILSAKTSPHIAKLVCEIILRAPNTIKFDAHFRWNLIESDPDDNKFVDCSIVANARYIVTEDTHFNVLKNIAFPHIEVINLDDFQDLMSLYTGN